MTGNGGNLAIFVCKTAGFAMKIISRLFLALAVSVFATHLAAQDRSPRPLSFEEALQIALTDNPAMRAAAYEERAAAQERRAAIGLRMPQIGFSGAYTYMGKDIGLDFNDMKKPAGDLFQGAVQQGIIPAQSVSQLQTLMAPVMQADWFLKLQDRSFGFVGGEVTLPLYMGGKINAANRAARLKEQAAGEQGDRTRHMLISELVERYFGLVLATQAVEVRRQAVEGVHRHLDEARSLEKNGMLARSERLYVEFKAAEAERELEDAVLQRETLANALKNTLNRTDEYRPASSLFILSHLEPVSYYRELAEERNPLLRQTAIQRRLAEENVKAQRAEFLPQVAAMGGASFYNYQTTGALPRWAVGVGVNIKIFDGLNREYKYSAARQTVRRAGALQEKARQDIGLLIDKSYNRMLNCRNRLNSIDASMTFAEEYLRAKTAAFHRGMSSSTDLIDAELNLAKVRIERMQAAYDFDSALARLLEAAGVSDEFMDYARRGDATSVGFAY